MDREKNNQQSRTGSRPNAGENRMSSGPDQFTESISVSTDANGTYHAHHDMTEDGLTVTIALALAEVADVEPKHVISDFTEYVDPDALNTLFRVRESEQTREVGYLHLSIEGYDVAVHSDGDIRIE